MVEWRLLSGLLLLSRPSIRLANSFLFVGSEMGSNFVRRALHTLNSFAKSDLERSMSRKIVHAQISLTDDSVLPLDPVNQKAGYDYHIL